MQDSVNECVFVLDDASYKSFIEQLEAPAQNAEGRQRLMDVKPEWSSTSNGGKP